LDLSLSFTHHPDKEGTERVLRLAVQGVRKSASHTIPIKRELKAGLHEPGLGSPPRFTHHPDKEGTERARASSSLKVSWCASHTIPIKRELKVKEAEKTPHDMEGFTHHPDKEGTERNPAADAKHDHHQLHTPSR